MLILRKRTLPQRINHSKQNTWTTIKSKTRLRSENLHFETLYSRPETPSRGELLKNTEKSEITQIKTPISNRSQTEDVEKIILKNKLTLNLVQKTTPSFNELPVITSFDKMRNLLITSPLYRKYSEINRKNGEVQSLLTRLQREFDLADAKIRVNKNSKKVVRSSQVSEKQPQDLAENVPHFNKQVLILRSSSMNNFKKTKVFTQKMHHSEHGQKRCLSKGGWRLKDFYDHIEQQSENNSYRINKVKQRQEIFNKLKKINEQCKVLENNSCEITKFIDVFAKYNENLSDKLVKKHRKINKIYYSEHY